MHLTSRTLTTIFLSILAISSAFAQSPKPASQSVGDLNFPDVEGWSRSDKVAIPVEESGFTVNYDSVARERMTVYVYTRGSSPLPKDLSGIIKEEFEGAKDAIKMVAEAGMYTNLKELKSEKSTVGGANGKVKALHALLSFDVKGTKMRSEIFVFAHKDHVIKLRVTRPEAVSKDRDASYAQLLTSIDGLFSSGPAK